MTLNWIAADITTFMEALTHLGLKNRTVQQLREEGITSPNDLLDFDDDSIDVLVTNLRKPAKKTVGVGAAATLTEVEPFTISAKSVHRLKVAVKVAKYYVDTGRPMDVDNMAWIRMRSFEIQFKALEERKKADKSEPPKLTKGLSIPKWLEAFHLYCRAVLGVRGVPLAYLLREAAAVSVQPPALMVAEPHSEEHGSIEGEMIARASHIHPLVRMDLGLVYDALETSLRHTSLMPTLSPHRRTRNGRAAYLAIRSQYAGKEVWEAMIAQALDYLTNRKWTGTANITLARHCAKSREHYIKMVEASEHVPHECPNERTRVGWLLASITCMDPQVLAACAVVRQDEADKRKDFENAVAYLVPACPVQKKNQQKGKALPQADISAVGAGKGGDGGRKADLGVRTGPKTGVELRYYKAKEYKQLAKPMQDELREWRAENKRKLANGKKNDTKRLKAMVSSAMAEQKSAIEATAAALQGVTAALATRWVPPSAAAPAPAADANVSAVAFQQMQSPEPPAAAAPAAAPSGAALGQLAEVAALKLKGIIKGGKKSQG